MLYAKTLVLNKQYNTANVLLKAIQILPNEGATEGRQLYRENQLMLALDEMEKKNYKKALQYIVDSRQWPGQPGVGKPYSEDIDERVENWLAYESYKSLGNEQAARAMLDKILAFDASNNEDGRCFRR
jgi:hypothetical protein